MALLRKGLTSFKLRSRVAEDRPFFYLLQVCPVTRNPDPGLSGDHTDKDTVFKYAAVVHVLKVNPSFISID